MNNNFNANELNEIITQIETTEREMEKLFNKIGNNFSSLSGIVSSEDSSLSGTCNNIQGTYKNLSVKLSNNLDIIKTTLTNYVQQTIQNEETSAQNVTKVNEGLSNAKSMLDSL